MDKYSVRSIMDNDNLVSYIMLLTGVTCKAPPKFITIVIQDFNQAV